MKKNIYEFIPFEHDNLNYINGSLNLARQQKASPTIEGKMAACVIYANLVEYLAKNILDNLQQMLHLLSYSALNGIFFIKCADEISYKKPKMLGELIGSLNCYEFPDKNNYLESLKKFSEARKVIFHRLLSMSQEELEKSNIDQKISELHELAEEILNKYNTITKGISESWFIAVDKLQKQETKKLETNVQNN